MKIKPKIQLNNDILEIIKKTYEENYNIQILTLFSQNGQNIYGCFIHSLSNKLSFVEKPSNIYVNTIDDFKITLLEVSDILYASYHIGNLEWLNVMLSSSDIEISNNKTFLSLQQLVRENIPLSVAKIEIINKIKIFEDSYDNCEIADAQMQIRSLLNKVNLFSSFCDDFNYEPFDIPNSHNDIICVKNHINKIKQDLLSLKLRKISNVKIHEIEKEYIKLQKQN